VALASNLFNYHPHHHWKNLHLRDLIQECKLEPLARRRGISGDWESPDITFRQVISLRDEGILAAVLGAIFPDSRQFSNEVLSDLKGGKVRRLSMDDEVYLFRFWGTASS
jgi:hypothetical protein